jgi:hypothetical protein
VAAIRRITAFPAGLSLDTVVLARKVHAEAAHRWENEATTQREAEVIDKREREAAAQQESKARSAVGGTAAAERERLRKQARTEQRYLPQFQEGDTLRLAMLTPCRRCPVAGRLPVDQLKDRRSLPARSLLLGDAASQGRPAHPRLCVAGDRAARGADRCRPAGLGCSGCWSSGAVECRRGLLRALPR